MDIFRDLSTNVLIAALLSVFAWCIGRLRVRPQVRHILWMMVLLKLVSPALISFPIWRSNELTASLWSRNLSEILEREPIRGSSEDQGVRTYGEYTWVRSAEFAAAKTSQSKFDFGKGLLSWKPMLVITWIVGAALTFFRAGRRSVAFSQALNSATPAPESWTIEVRTIATRLGVRSIPKLLFVEAKVPPLVWCVAGRSVLVLPSQLIHRLDWSQRRGIIAHELAHLLRGDHWLRWVELIVTGIYWWNPIAWWARTELHRAEEECCDALVVGAFPEIAVDYAQSLLETVDFLAVGCMKTPGYATTFAGFRPLERRITMILDASSQRRLSRPCKVLLWALVVVTLPMSVSAAPQNETPTSAANEATEGKSLRTEEDDSQPKTLAQSPDADRSSSAGDPLRPPTESVDARQALSRDKSEPARLELRFVNHWLNSPMQNVPVMIEDVAISGEVPFKKRNTLLALGGQLDLSIAPKTVRIGVEPDHEYTGYEVINPLPDTITLVAGQTFSHTFRFQPLREFRWPKLIDDTNLCSQRHQQAAAVLRSKGAFLRTDSRLVDSADSSPTTGVVLSETWSGTVEDLNRLLDLDAVVRIEIGRHPIRSQLQRETRLLPTVTDEWLNIFGKVPELERLWLRNARITSRGIEHLCQSDKLRDLTIESGSFEGDGLAKLSRLPSLSSLVIKAPLRSNAVGSLGRFEHLKTLALSSNSSVSENLATLEAPDLNILVIEPADDASLVSLKRFRQLDYVTLSGPGVTDAEVSRLTDVNREIALLGTSVTDEGLAALSNCRISTVTLQGPFTDNGLAELRKMPNLLRARFVGAMVSDAAVSDLQQQKPTLTITRTNRLGDDWLRSF